MIKNRDANNELNKAKDNIDRAIQILEEDEGTLKELKKLDEIIMKIEKLQNC